MATPIVESIFAAGGCPVGGCPVGGKISTFEVLSRGFDINVLAEERGIRVLSVNYTIYKENEDRTVLIAKIDRTIKVK